MIQTGYRPVTDGQLAARWVLWAIGVAISLYAIGRFVYLGPQEPEVQRMAIVLVLYWLAWVVRYVSISRHYKVSDSRG